jgi:hypothetical protein
MIYLALSCFQGRTMTEAARTLVDLAPGRVGLQLTPGCAPSYIDVDCPIRTHHGFTPRALRQQVWIDGVLQWNGDSLHPPKSDEAPQDWSAPEGVILETMYPGYADLSNGEQIARAMDAGRLLAVDVSHLSIQMYHGIIESSIVKRLLEYERIAEVHVSTSRDSRDVHAKLTDETWGIEWAKDRLEKGIPVVLECYMHKLSHEERLEQLGRLISM